MESLEQRFWKFPLLGGECWEWQGARNARGYGLFNHKGCRLAHRMSWLLERGPVPDGLHVLHRCDNPSCVRPAHLFLGTDKDNVRDAIAKGRFVYIPENRKRINVPSGERHFKAKLTRDQVAEIRQRYTPWDKRNSGAALAREFGVGTHNIFCIVKGRSWKL